VPALGDKRLDEITTDDVELLKARMIAEKLHPKTVNNALGVLRTCLGHAVDAGKVDKLPKIRRLKVPPRDTDFYSFEEADALVAGAAAGWPRRAIKLALRTALRQGEERGLQWDDVDFRSAQVHVQRSLSQDGTVARPPKNNRCRWVPLSPQALAAIKEQRADTMLRSKWVLCDDEGKPLTRAACEHQLKLACRKAGLRKIRWHDLRHTCASHLVMKGVPMRTVQEVLGHSTIGMTERYSHLAPNAKHEAVALLDETVVTVAQAPARQTDGKSGSVIAEVPGK
jgi:integrase